MVTFFCSQIDPNILSTLAQDLVLCTVANLVYFLDENVSVCFL